MLCIFPFRHGFSELFFRIVVWQLSQKSQINARFGVFPWKNFWPKALRKIPKFHLISWSRHFKETHSFCSFGRFVRENCPFSQNFLTKKLGEISVFYLQWIYAFIKRSLDVFQGLWWSISEQLFVERNFYLHW